MSNSDYVFKPDHDLVDQAILEDCRSKEAAAQRVMNHIESGEWALLLPSLNQDNLKEDIKSRLSKR